MAYNGPGSVVHNEGKRTSYNRSGPCSCGIYSLMRGEIEINKIIKKKNKDKLPLGEEILDKMRASDRGE